MRPHLSCGIYKNAEWLDTDGSLDEWVDVCAAGARRCTALERTLRQMDKSKWESEQRNLFIADDCWLWQDSPKLVATGAPPTTPLERCQALAGIIRKYIWERRHLYSTWVRRCGSAPMPDQEAAGIMLHMDMRRCKFVGNHYVRCLGIGSQEDP